VTGWYDESRVDQQARQISQAVWDLWLALKTRARGASSSVRRAINRPQAGRNTLKRVACGA